jgi:DNA invertase Pin-like site-specific DNA recombinase
MTIYGYARVSTTGQTLATQKALLKAAGVTRIFSEKVSGVATRRPELARVLDELESGDVLVVTKLDRLARSTLDLLRMVDQIGREGAGFKSVGEPWGRHHDVDGASDAHRIVRDCRVRARPDSAADQRGPDARYGRGHEVRSQAEAHPSIRRARR